MYKKKIQRAYSFVNAPSNKNLEIYIVRVVNGKLSNILYNLNVGDDILIKKHAFGFFTLKEIPNCNTLWMFATGTAIGPYCSILQENGLDTKKFQNIVLIHAVRYTHELTYLSLMKKLCIAYNGKLKIQTIVSRDTNRYSLFGRIPSLIKNNEIEKRIGLKIDPNTSHVMLCGNPDMVKETYTLLNQTKNMNKHFRKKIGHITMENYW